MRGGSVWVEREFKVSASEVWKVYSTFLVDEVLKKRLTQVFKKVKIVDGNGGVGSIIHILFHPEMPGPLKSYKEKLTVMDREKRVKVAEGADDGFLELGFTLYRTRIEVLEKEGKEKECTTRVTVEYELKEEAAANASLVTIEAFSALLQLIVDYMHENNNNNNSNANNNSY